MLRGCESDLEMFPHFILFISPPFSPWGLSRETIRSGTRERGGALGAGPQYRQCPPCGSAALLDSSCLRADQFLREAATLWSGEMQHFPTSHSGDPASPTGDR